MQRLFSSRLSLCAATHRSSSCAFIRLTSSSTLFTSHQHMSTWQQDLKERILRERERANALNSVPASHMEVVDLSSSPSTSSRRHDKETKDNQQQQQQHQQQPEEDYDSMSDHQMSTVTRSHYSDAHRQQFLNDAEEEDGNTKSSGNSSSTGGEEGGDDVDALTYAEAKEIYEERKAAVEVLRSKRAEDREKKARWLLWQSSQREKGFEQRVRRELKKKVSSKNLRYSAIGSRLLAVGRPEGAAYRHDGSNEKQHQQSGAAGMEEDEEAMFLKSQKDKQRWASEDEEFDDLLSVQRPGWGRGNIPTPRDEGTNTMGAIYGMRKY